MSATRPKPSPQLAELAPTLFQELNACAFNAALPHDIPLIWNRRLRRSAGRCRFLLIDERRSAEIELSPHVLTSTERLRTTLAHEMCHAAQYLIDGEARPPHGPAFQRWARLLEKRVPDLTITTTHSYDVATRFSYRCTACGAAYGRHARLDLRRRCCGRCGGALRLEAGESGLATGATTRPMPPFAAFVAQEYAALRKRWPNVPHQRLMTTLGNKWRREKQKGNGKRTSRRRHQ